MMLPITHLAITSGAQTGRARSEPAPRSAKRSHDVRRGASAWTAETDFAGGSIEPLMVHSVADKTGLYRYLPQVRRFLIYAIKHQLPVTTAEAHDRSLATYLCIQAYREEQSPHVGDFLPNGMNYIWPEFANTTPRAWRCLNRWHKMHIHGEGGPEVVELLACMEHQMRLQGGHAEADALAVALGCYLSTVGLFMLRIEDVIFALNPDGEKEAMLRLGVAERAESTKTGMRQGVRVDSPYVLKILEQLTATAKPNSKVFATTAARYCASWTKAASNLGVQNKIGPPHSVRHSGPSHDSATGYRSIWQIQRRGRWSSERPVLRYAKTHTWLEVRARVPAHLMEQGTALLAQRPLRSKVARE